MKKLISFICLAIATNLTAQEHSNANSPFTQNLTDAYIALQTALANDDLNAAKAATAPYIAAFETSTAGLNTEHFAKSAREIAATDDIAQARAAFKELSLQAKTLFDYLKPNDETPLYLVHCSMAFNGEGAIWIQDSTEITNPYYGASMLHCGEIKRGFGPQAEPSSTAAQACPTGATCTPNTKTSTDACCKSSTQ